MSSNKGKTAVCGFNILCDDWGGDDWLQSVGWNDRPTAVLNTVSVQQARVEQYYQ